MSVYADPARQLVVEIVVRDFGLSRVFDEALEFELVEDTGKFVSLARERGQCFPRDAAAPEGLGEAA